MRDDKTHGVTCKGSYLAASQLPLREVLWESLLPCGSIPRSRHQYKPHHLLMPSHVPLFIALSHSHTHTLHTTWYMYICMCPWISLIWIKLNLPHILHWTLVFLHVWWIWFGQYPILCFAFFGYKIWDADGYFFCLDFC